MNVVQGTTALRGPLKEAEVVGDAAKELENPPPVVETIAAPPESLRPSTIGPSTGMKRRPMFLSSEDEGSDASTPKKPRKERTRSPTPEIVAVEPTPAHRHKGRATALVAEADKVPQSVAKHGYPEHAYLLRWLIYQGHDVLKRPAKCGRCLHYGHTCSGEAGMMCGRCIPNHQGCVAAEVLVPPLEYVAKDEKDSREPEVKERGSKGKSKGKAKDKGSSSISSKGVLGTRTSTLASKERMEELVERSEDLMRSVSRKLNDLSGEVLELEGVQEMIRKLAK
ncbi:hypothetical protein JB92DRAFT_3008604 [Gautieria morchelliformis]|nr:hypothetical protein JB92DRAFT_3008604 [Gautieria morchelliformis]